MQLKIVNQYTQVTFVSPINEYVRLSLLPVITPNVHHWLTYLIVFNSKKQ